jgi:hypothetical protein
VERHIDASGYAGACDDLAIIDKTLIRTWLDVGAERQQLLEGGRVSRNGSAVEQASVAVHKGARVHACHEGPRLFESAQSPPNRLVAELGTCSAPAGVNKDVDLPKLLPTHLGNDAHAFGTRDGDGALADHDKFDVVWAEEAPGTQNFPRAREIELFGPFEHGNCDPHLQPCKSGPWQPDCSPRHRLAVRAEM